MLYDVINYNDIIFAADSLESVTDALFADV